MGEALRAWRPSYLKLLRSGELYERVQRLEKMLPECTVCPRACHIDRRSEFGSCATGSDAVIASWNAHFGEEPTISCVRGSGTVFLANCNLSCAFCQNHDISQPSHPQMSREMSAQELATVFLSLQDRGCHNLNWVSPTHQVPQLIRALTIAANRGLSIPVVYNTNGYDSVEVLRLLENVVDIYMPDLKYADPELGYRLSGIEDYPQRAREALSEMFRQLGDTWELGPQGELRRGLLVRMLVLPNGLAGIEENLAWVSNTLSPRISISLLAQYRPAHRVQREPALSDLGQCISDTEWKRAVSALQKHMEGNRHHVQKT